MSLKICVYAICKNEINNIKSWLESMSEADYIVVLDTGSSDGTFEELSKDSRITRLEQMTIDPWRFDVARNESLKLVPDDADILVCTDFDERFASGWGEWLRANWNPKQHNRCHYDYIWSHGEKGEPQNVFRYDKIHSRGFKWVYPVHEVLMPISFDMNINWLEADDHIILHHFQDQDKARNYLSLLQISAEENPNDAHVIMLLGREYYGLQDYANALETLCQGLQKANNIEKVDGGLCLLQIIYIIACSFYAVGQYDRSLHYCQEFIKLDSTYREPYFLMAKIYIVQRAYVLAESIILGALKHTTFKKNWVETSISWSYEANLLLAAIYTEWHDYSAAIEHLTTILKYTDNIDVWKQYAYCLEQKLKESN